MELVVNKELWNDVDNNLKSLLKAKEDAIITLHGGPFNCA